MEIFKLKKLYFDPFIDLCNLEMLSYGISKRPSVESIMASLKETIKITSDCKYRRTFHSDQGWGVSDESLYKRAKLK